jgi:hypothetical protein
VGETVGEEIHIVKPDLCLQLLEYFGKYLPMILGKGAARFLIGYSIVDSWYVNRLEVEVAAEAPFPKRRG